MLNKALAIIDQQKILTQELLNMQYLTYPPLNCLKPFVRYFWSFQSANNPDIPLQLHTMVDDSSGILFTCGRGVIQRPDGNFVLPEAIIHGQTTVPTKVHLTGPFTTIGVLFYPHAIKELFGIDAYHLTDQVLPLDNIAKFNDHNKLMEVGTPAEKVSIIEEWLAIIAVQYTSHDALVVEQLHKIYHAVENFQLTKIFSELSITSRQFERRFRSVTGVSPRHLIKVLRFQKGIRLIRDKKFTKLSDIAYELNYYDQAHFVRHVKELSGFTPSQLSSVLKIDLVNLLVKE